MYEYTTISSLRSLGSRVLKEERASIIKSASAASPKGSTFLSHSSLDEEMLSGLLKVLQDHGARVYIDKKDSSLPPTTSPETASVLKSKISESSTFILFATKNSKDSRWVPWELGVADGLKKTANVAVWPGVENANDYKWSEQEYLGLYRRIVFGDLKGYPNKVWMVLNFHENTATELSNWLK